MLGTIERFPQEFPEGMWWHQRWHLRNKGSTVDALDEWTAVMTWHDPVTVLPNPDRRHLLKQ
jgi:hypothetical protein